MDKDNNIKEPDSSETSWFYEGLFDQMEEEENSDLFDVLDNRKKKKEVNIDNIYNEIADD